MDTIFAQSTRPGKSGVAVFRISGQSSFNALKQLLQEDDILLVPNTLSYRKIYNPENKAAQ